MVIYFLHDAEHGCYMVSSDREKETHLAVINCGYGNDFLAVEAFVADLCKAFPNFFCLMEN